MPMLYIPEYIDMATAVDLCGVFFINWSWKATLNMVMCKPIEAHMIAAVTLFIAAG